MSNNNKYNYLQQQERFHLYSKLPVRDGQTLGVAANKAGHTIATDDVWAEEIPLFINGYDPLTAITTLKNHEYGTLIMIADIMSGVAGRNLVYQRTDNVPSGETYQEVYDPYDEEVVMPQFARLWKPLGKESDGVLHDGDTIANKHGNVVLKYHRNATVSPLTPSNNATQGSNGTAGRIFATITDGDIKSEYVVSRFVSSTDKIVNGVPSVGYAPVIGYKEQGKENPSRIGIGEDSSDTSTTYSVNCYSGVIFFHSDYSKYTIGANVFEYIGKTLDKTIQTLQKSSKKRLTTIFKNKEDARLIIGEPEPNIVDGVQQGTKISIDLAQNVATTDTDETEGTVYSKQQIDQKLQEISASGVSGGYVKTINSINTENGAEIVIDAISDKNYLGSSLTSLITQDNKITINVSPSKDWSYTGSSLVDVTTVENGFAKTSDGTLVFVMDVKNLTTGSGMFSGGNLQSFIGDLSNLRRGDTMFAGTNLTSFVGDLGKLTHGEHMFSLCSNLTYFNSDLSSLEYGDGMFSSCKLNEESVEIICDMLPTVTENTHENGIYTITIDGDTSQDIIDYVNKTASSKNWKISFNGQVYPQ